VPQAASAVSYEDLQLISEIIRLTAIVGGGASNVCDEPSISRLAFDITEGNPAGIYSADGVPQLEAPGDTTDV